MSYKFIPAIQKLKREIVAIGNDEIGKVYFLKRYCRVAGEREALDATEKNQNEGQFLLVQLADKIKKDKGISTEAAYGYIFPSEENNEVVKDFNPMVEYPDEMRALLGLRSQTNRMKDAVATVMMNTRVAFPIELTANADINSESLEVVGLSFPLQNNDLIKFGSCTAKVVGNHEADAESVTIQPLSEKLASGRVGFLANFESGKEKVGYSDWTTEDTKQLPENLIEEIFAFYQREAAGVGEVQEETVTKKNEPKKATKKSLKASDDSVSNPQ